MQCIEKSFKERNKELGVELQNARHEANDYRVENKRLKNQILRLVELDEVKNKDIQTLEEKVEHFHEKLEDILEHNLQSNRVSSMVGGPSNGS